MTPDEQWLAAMWPFVRSQLPAAPAPVIEIGCGPLGGFVPMLAAAGYQAVGADPEAPAGPEYRQTEFERSGLPGPAAAIVACTSLHHVADLGEVLDLVSATLVPGGRVVVVEWARERFDEATAQWCFSRLGPPGDEPSFLHGQQEQWRESGRPWDAWCRSWAEAEGLHPGADILRELAARFGPGTVSYGPYFFPELDGTSEADEQAAIDRGDIRANRIQYTGQRPS